MAFLYIKSLTDDQKLKLKNIAKSKGKTLSQFVKDWIDRLRE